MLSLTRSLVRSHALRQGLQMMQVASGKSAVRAVAMKIVPAPKPDCSETYEEKNERLGRELSPHLTIYKPQLTSILSITHRMTGFACGVYTWALGLGALMTSHDVCHYVIMFEGLQLGSASLSALKFLIVFPFIFHTCNGLRHLAWDTGRFLKLKEVYSTGYAMIAASVILSGALAAI